MKLEHFAYYFVTNININSMNPIKGIFFICAIITSILCNMVILFDMFMQTCIIVFKIINPHNFQISNYYLQKYNTDLTIYIFLSGLIDILSLYVMSKYISTSFKNVPKNIDIKINNLEKKNGETKGEIEEEEETDNDETEKEETEEEETDDDEIEEEETEEEETDDDETEEEETDDDETEKEGTEEEETDDDETEEDEIEEERIEEICVMNNERMITNCMILLEGNAKDINRKNKCIKTLERKIENYEIIDKSNNYYYDFLKMMCLCFLLQIIMANLFSINNIEFEHQFLVYYIFKIVTINILASSYQYIDNFF